MQKTSFRLTAGQQEKLNRLYRGKTVKRNGGPMFGLLGQAFIDPEQSAGPFGTAEFYWLDHDQYTHVKRAIRQARNFELTSDSPLSPERLRQIARITDELNNGAFEAVNAQGAIMTLLAAFEEALALAEKET